MATFTVWTFDDPTAADRSVDLLESLQKQELIRVHDAATVSWEPGKKKPKTRQLRSMTGAGALGGSFWGFLFGLLFFVPLLGAAIGAATGALAGSMTDVGIDDSFIKQVREQVTPGTSALFALTGDAVQDKVLQAFEESGLHPELIHTNLSNEQEASLREAFGE
ncbi:DUF1269 domain-containing protein [Jiangella alkaliphila]|uniref:Uncharacterized membrane protein n=1 Tax=Jiangella alkaliphila TaxID=419479 RepID=A0A1H2LDH7_9ACTN|nr:DUF1269 domain-containing protein [Jiangella alkaliphila]SDU78785.1 Uncharacterized membrane protein [Jiangella alkaliphila]